MDQKLKFSKHAKAFVEKYNIQRFVGLEKFDPNHFTDQEREQFTQFKKELNKARLHLHYEKRVANGTAPRHTPTNTLSAKELEKRRKSGAEYAAKVYQTKQRLAEFARRRGIPTPPLNKATITTMRQALIRGGIPEHHLATIEKPPPAAKSPEKKKNTPEPTPQEARNKALACEASNKSYVRRRALYKRAHVFAAMAPFVDMTIEQIRDILRQHITETEMADIETQALREYEESHEIVERQGPVSRSLDLLDQFFAKHPDIPKVSMVRHMTQEDQSQYKRYLRSLDPERFRARDRAYDALHREKRKEANRKRRQENPERVREIEWQSANTENGSLNCYFKDIRYGSEKRGIPFEIDKDDVVEMSQRPCYYCNQLIERYGVDAIEFRVGFVEGNVVPCCTLCNKMKKDNDWRDFVRMACNIAAKHTNDEDANWNFDYNFFKDSKRYKSGSFAKYANEAEPRGKRFELSKEFFNNLVAQDCYYCGVNPQTYNVGLDRVDSSGHYTERNVVPSCGPCNFMKRDASQDLFIAKAKHIFKHWSTRLVLSGK